MKILLSVLVCKILLYNIVSSKTLLEYLKEDASISKFVQAIEDSEETIRSAFDSPNPSFCLTIFIPSNDVFNIPSENVKEILGSHFLTMPTKSVCGDKEQLKSVSFEGTRNPSKSEGFKNIIKNTAYDFTSELYLYHSGTQVFVNGALLGQHKTVTDSNKNIGMYYIVDKMLVTGFQNQEFTKLLEGRSDLSKSQGYWKAYMSNISNNEKQYFTITFGANTKYYKTFFIPTNEAWNTLLSDQISELDKDNNLLKEILNYHFISDTVVYSNWGNPIEVKGGIPGANDNTIKVGSNGVQSKGTSSEITESIATNLGVVHIIKIPLGMARDTMSKALQDKAPNFFTFCESNSVCKDLLENYKSGTIFAPQDGTFDILKNMNNDEASLRLYLSLHMLPNKYSFVSTQDSQIITIADKGELRFRTIDNKRYVEARLRNQGFVRCEIVESDVNTKEGTLQVIKNVMGYATQNVYEFLQSHEETKDYSTFVTANGFEPDLKFTGPFTIFAPTQNALLNMKADSSLGATIYGQSLQMTKVMRRTIILNKVLIEELDTGKTYDMADANYGNFKEYLKMEVTIDTSIQETWKRRVAKLKSRVDIPVLLQSSGYRTTNGLVYFIDIVPYTENDKEAPKTGEFKTISGNDSDKLIVSAKFFSALLISVLLWRSSL